MEMLDIKQLFEQVNIDHNSCEKPDLNKWKESEQEYDKQKKFVIFFLVALLIALIITSGGADFPENSNSFSTILWILLLGSWIFAVVEFITKKRILAQLIGMSHCKCLTGVCMKIDHIMAEDVVRKNYKFALFDDLTRKFDMSAYGSKNCIMNVDVGDKVCVAQYFKRYYVVFPLEKKRKKKWKKNINFVLLFLVLVGINGCFSCATTDFAKKISVLDKSKSMIDMVDKNSVQVDETGNIYVKDCSNILVFDSDGAFQYRMEFPVSGGAMGFGIEKQRVSVYIHRTNTYYEVENKVVVFSKEAEYEEIEDKINKDATINGYQYQRKGYRKIVKTNSQTKEKDVIRLKGIKLFPLPLFANWLILAISGCLFMILNPEKILERFSENSFW